VSNQQPIKVIRNHTENAQQMISCEHWYYTKASYKDDHELSSYQQFEEGGGRDVNNDHSAHAAEQIIHSLNKSSIINCIDQKLL